MALVLRQSTATDVLIGPFVDSTDGVTAETALTISQADVLLSKNGQTLAQKNDATAAAHDANGYYNCELDATDTNTVGTLVLTVTESGALPVRHEFQIIEEAAYDAMYAASAVGPLLANDTGDGLTAIPWNASWDAEVQSEVTDALNAYDPPTNAELEARTLEAASYATAAALATVDGNVDSILEDTGTTIPATLSTIAGYIDTEVAAIKAVTDNLPDSGALTSLATAAALATVDANVDAILVDTGTTIPGTLANLATSAALATVDSNVDAILVDTGTTLPASIATIDGNVDSILVDTGTTLPATLATLATASALATVDANVDAILVDTGTTLDGKLDTIDTVVDAVKAKTDQLTFTKANELDSNTQSINGVTLTGDGSANPMDAA